MDLLFPRGEKRKAFFRAGRIEISSLMNNEPLEDK